MLRSLDQVFDFTSLSATHPALPTERRSIPAISSSNASVLSYEYRIPTFAPGSTCLSSRFSTYVTSSSRLPSRFASGSEFWFFGVPVFLGVSGFFWRAYELRFGTTVRAYIALCSN